MLLLLLLLLPVTGGYLVNSPRPKLPGSSLMHHIFELRDPESKISGDVFTQEDP